MGQTELVFSAKGGIGHGQQCTMLLVTNKSCSQQLGVPCEDFFLLLRHYVSLYLYIGP